MNSDLDNLSPSELENSDSEESYRDCDHFDSIRNSINDRINELRSDSHYENSRDEIRQMMSDIADPMPSAKIEKLPRKKTIPKAILENKKKYLENREKMQRLQEEERKSQDNQLAPKTVLKRTVPEGQKMRRINIGGRIKYVPIKEVSITNCPEPIVTKSVTNYTSPDGSVKKSITQTIKHSESSFNSSSFGENDVPKNRPTIKKSSTCSNARQKKIPPQIAKKIEEQVKRQTKKNARNINDLRKINALENLDLNGQDPEMIGMQELRKMRAQQRKRELEEKRKEESNYKDSAVQQILGDESLSKFAKMVAIKNLSVNSRKRQVAKPKHSENTQKPVYEI
jgi:hypothetical protein